MNVNEYRKILSELQRNIEKVVEQGGEYLENVRYKHRSDNEMFLRSQMMVIQIKLDEIQRQIAYLNKPVEEEGVLRKNSEGRLAFPSGRYFTSGDTIELLSKNDGWFVTRIEHSGDYYAVELGKGKSIEGMYARVRKS